MAVNYSYELEKSHFTTRVSLPTYGFLYETA
jgi:hypothetical protein